MTQDADGNCVYDDEYIIRQKINLGVIAKTLSNYQGSFCGYHIYIDNSANVGVKYSYYTLSETYFYPPI